MQVVFFKGIIRSVGMTRFILGNWKMHLGAEKAKSLAAATCALTPPQGVKVAVFPPYITIPAVAEVVGNSRVGLGAQDCSANATDGAFTGEVSATMLKDAGCDYVIIGHSERRQYHTETNALIRRKAEVALAAGLTAVICVGESQAERAAGKHLSVVSQQVKECLPSLAHNNSVIIAYEPVWAIGSGATPTLAEITQVHKTIASLLTYDTPAARTAIVYGGSVKAANAKDILSADAVDGALVGGASLKPEEFSAIISAAAH